MIFGPSRKLKLPEGQIPLVDFGFADAVAKHTTSCSTMVVQQLVDKGEEFLFIAPEEKKVCFQLVSQLEGRHLIMSGVSVKA